MKNYMKIAFIRVLVVLLWVVCLPGDMVAAAQAPQVEKLTLNVPVLPVKPVAVEPVVVVPVAQQAVVQSAVVQPSANNAVPAAAPVAGVQVVAPTDAVAAPVATVVAPAAAVQTAVAANIPAAHVVSAAAVPVPTAMPMPTVVDLNTKIKQLYGAMQQAQNKVYDAATYANFGSTLVGVFNEAVETQSYMIQLLNAASITPLLNAEQQNYVRQAMIPNLDQIDETTKPLAPAPAVKSPSRAQLHAVARATRASNVRTTPGGKKKRKKRKKGKKKAAAAASAAALIHASHKTGKKHTTQRAVDATAGVAMARPMAGGTNQSVGNHKKIKHGKKAHHASTTPPVAVTVPDPVVPVVVAPGGTGAIDGDIIL